MSLKRAWEFLGGTWWPHSAADALAPSPGSGGGEVVVRGTDGVVRWGTAVGAELLAEDGAGELLFDDATGDVLYEG